MRLILLTLSFSFFILPAYSQQNGAGNGKLKDPQKNNLYSVNRTLVLFKDKSITLRQLEIFKLVEAELLAKENVARYERLSYYSQLPSKLSSDEEDRSVLMRFLLVVLTARDASVFSSANQFEGDDEKIQINLSTVLKKKSDAVKIQATQEEINQLINQVWSAMDYLKFRLSTMQTAGASDSKGIREKNLKAFFDNLMKKNKVKFL